MTLNLASTLSRSLMSSYKRQAHAEDSARERHYSQRATSGVLTEINVEIIGRSAEWLSRWGLKLRGV